MHIVRLKLRPNNEQGFLCTLTANHRHPPIELEGTLSAPPAELQDAFRTWQAAYLGIDAVRQVVSFAAECRLKPVSMETSALADRVQLVKTYLNTWLNSGGSGWQTIRDGLIAVAHQVRQAEDSEVHILLDIKDIHLRRLPWQEWDVLMQHYPKADIALTAPKDSTFSGLHPTLPESQPRILVAVGRSEGINTQADLEAIQQLTARGAEVIFLMQPSIHALCEALWCDRGYHIFVYTGHSRSREDGQIGWIELNDRETLDIDKFINALREAIDKGLQLAMFNSCDGLGLANQLAELKLPRCIVMREPVPDAVAVSFLRYFFEEFARGRSLFASMLRARRRLEPFQYFYPGTMWLPTACVKLAASPLTWKSIGGELPQDRVPLPPSPPASDRETAPSDRVPTAGSPPESPREPRQSRFPGREVAIAGLLLAVVAVGTIFFRNVGSRQPSTLNIPSSALKPDLRSVSPPPGNWSYGGSTSWAPVRGIVDVQIKAVHPDFNLIYRSHPSKEPGSGTGIEMVLAGQLSFSQSSRELNEEDYQAAERIGVKLKQVPVAFDALAFAVHPDLAIAGLSVQQIRGIYTGQITNWSQVGGPDLAIVPYSRPEGSGTTIYFKEYVLGWQEFGSNVVFIDETTDNLRQVSNDSNIGGIYYATAPEIVPQCTVKPLPISQESLDRFVSPYQGKYVPPEACPGRRNRLNMAAFREGQYPLMRTMFAIIRADGSEHQWAGEAYAKLLLTDEGQRLMEQAGYVPIRLGRDR